MEAVTMYDPETRQYVEVRKAYPSTCNHCGNSINAYAVINFNGNCEDCWENGNNYEALEQQMQQSNEC